MTNHLLRGLTHYRTTYYRPSWQGGDTTQPLCCKPLHGFAGSWSQGHPDTDSWDAVDCPHCLAARGRPRPPEPAFLPPPKVTPHRTRQLRATAPTRLFEPKGPDETHVYQVWQASAGRMFPFCVEQRKAA